ncbi:hypothetical protein SESBI_36818 [Sesbania bispinosa]|nr:hypothetical protein SESBI_36818 [Sesbania bispinosa]
MEINGSAYSDNKKVDHSANKDLQNQEGENSYSLDQIHGEWLVVSRSKKKTQAKGKGKLHEESKQGKEHKFNRVVEDGEKKSFSHSFKPTPEDAKIVFEKLHEDSKQGKEHKFIKAPSKNVRSTTLVNSNEPSKIEVNDSVFSIMNSKDHEFGILTTMDVEILGANRLRFKEVEEPIGDAILEKNLDKHLEVHLQPHHVSDDRREIILRIQMMLWLGKSKALVRSLMMMRMP